MSIVNRLRHCPNCGGEVIVWDDELMADRCIDCGESWTVEEQEAVQEAYTEAQYIEDLENRSMG